MGVSRFPLLPQPGAWGSVKREVCAGGVREIRNGVEPGSRIASRSRSSLSILLQPHEVTRVPLLWVPFQWAGSQ